MTARLQHIADLVANPAGVPYAGLNLSAQVFSNATLLKYKHAPDTQEIRASDIVKVQLRSDGTFDLYLTAPQDMVGVADGGDFDPQAYYVLTLPSGQQISTTTFAYTGGTLTLSDITDAAAAPGITTAAVHFVRARTDDTGTPVQIAAYISAANAFIGDVYLGDAPFLYTLPGNGDGYMQLPPNSLITPDGTSWKIFVGGNAIGVDIVVPTIGGNFLDLVTSVLSPGDLPADPSDGGDSYIEISTATTTHITGIKRLAWLHTYSAGGTLGQVTIYPASTAVGTPIYDETPDAVTHEDLQIGIAGDALTIVTAAATKLLISYYA